LKILILKPSSLGDVVQALPVLRLLKAHRPESEIYWWISTELSGLLEGDPDLSGIFLFDRRRWASPVNWGGLLRSVREARAMQFDLVIDLQGLARSGFFAWFSNAKLSVGLEDWREGALGFYDVVVPRPSFHTHAVDWYLEVLKVLGVPIHWEFNWLPPRHEVLKPLLETCDPRRFRWVLISPGARWNNKRWPVEYYAAVVRELSASSSDLHFAVIGGKSDASLGAAIQQAAPERCLDLTGKTSLLEMVEWVRLGVLMITNDTGPMHVAAALNKPVVSIFGPTEPRRTGPYRQVEHALRTVLPCVPCMEPVCRIEKPIECLRAITPERVCGEIRRRLC
jgi:heptosyltransferase I